MANGDRRRKDLPKEVHRASHAPPTADQDVSVNHRGADVPVTQQFLDRPDVVSVLEQVSGEGMTELVAGDMLFDVGHRRACLTAR
jgi:hypothetical protein